LFLFLRAAGLIYQVAWSKRWADLDIRPSGGHRSRCVHGRLAAGARGLAGGARAAIGPLRCTAGLEIGVAASGAVRWLAWLRSRAVYVAAYPIASGHSATLLALRFFGAAIVLFLPTFLMGGTLPVLVRGLRGIQPNWNAARAALLGQYGGSCRGTVAAGFYFYLYWGCGKHWPVLLRSICSQSPRAQAFA